MTGSCILFRLIDYLRRLIDSLTLSNRKLTTLVYRPYSSEAEWAYLSILLLTAACVKYLPERRVECLLITKFIHYSFLSLDSSGTPVTVHASEMPADWAELRFVYTYSALAPSIAVLVRGTLLVINLLNLGHTLDHILGVRTPLQDRHPQVRRLCLTCKVCWTNQASSFHLNIQILSCSRANRDRNPQSRLSVSESPEIL